MSKKISTESSYKLTPDDVTRCPECNLICSLNLRFNKENNKLNIYYKCDNLHNGFINIKEYVEHYNEKSITKEKCNECQKYIKEIKGNCFYCSTCYIFLCNLCQEKHPNQNDHHDLINYIRYDALCKEHSNLYNCYCENCDKNMCIYCQGIHEKNINHKIIHLFDYIFDKEEKNSFLKEIENIKIKINNLEDIKNNIIHEINEIIEINKSIIKFSKILLRSYKYQQNQKNLNYYIVQNLKSCHLMNSSKEEKLNKVFLEGKKYISFLQDMKTIHIKNFKILKDHSSTINYLNQLRDGRLVSCSSDKTLKIYDKFSFNLQLTIDQHLDYVYSFTELNDGRIISCSKDKTMKVIKLIGEDKYHIEQTLEGHTGEVYKIIEIKDKQLISISNDKTMKIWKLKKNRFECNNSINIQDNPSYCNILQLNDKEFVTSSSYYNNCLKFWNINNCTKISEINNIESALNFHNLCLLEDDILCVGGKGNHFNFYYLIKISKHILFNTCDSRIQSIVKCLNGLFLCSGGDNDLSIIKCKYENGILKKIDEKNNAHENQIITCIELENGFIASGGNDKLIKLWID